MSEDLTKKLQKSDSDKLTMILTTLQNLEGRFEKLEIRVENIDSRLQRLEQKVEERLYDTRPNWQKLVADIAQLQEGQERLWAETREIKHSLRDISRHQRVLNDAILKVHVDLRDIDERLHELEVNRNRPDSST